MQARLRALSGSILFAYLTCHLLNHAFGLISFDALGIAHEILMEIWRTPLGSAILIGAMVTHIAVAFFSVYKRRTLKLTGLEITQIASGFVIPLLMINHVMGTRVAEEIAGIDPTYEYVIAALWVASPVLGVLQAVTLVLAWLHGCIGLYLWLRVKPWYQTWQRELTVVAIILPVLSLAGYVSAGFEILFELDRDHMISTILQDARYNSSAIEPLQALVTPLTFGLAVMGIAPFGARKLRALLEQKSRILLLLPDGTKVPVPAGATALEALRSSGRPHAAVCGGRGRCTTCRVKILEGGDLLESPEGLELTALTRIKAMAGVRLACQIRPKESLGISPLLPPTATAKDGQQLGGLEGEERRVTSLFIDIRASTKLAEEKLPYDVLFILNQFFSEMSSAITETNGHYAQFNGDGLMALYGLMGTEEEGARSALKGARAMLNRLDALNKSLASELPFPLRVGIGLHHGEAIVGAMGPPRAQITSAIGDTINIAARLEGLTKAHDVSVIFSQEVAQAAGVDTAGLERSEVPVRGRTAPVVFFPIRDPHRILPL